MSTPRRRKNSSVIQQLTEVPYDFSFFQAVRLLERSAVYKKQATTEAAVATNPVARFTPPGTEAIRFRSHQVLGFQSSEVSKITSRQQKSGSQQWDMLINFMGLSGATGVLPYHYTEMILQRLKIKDKSLLEFFDLFNHRTISLFYQAANKYKLPIEYERTSLNGTGTSNLDNPSQVLLSLVGLGTKSLANRLYTKDESILFYSGLFTQQIRTSSGLKQILKNHFEIPVDIREFIGQWQELIDDVRTRLPGKQVPQGQNNCLGKSVMLGRKGWFAQGKFSVILGPLNSQQLHKFSPGTKALKALNEIVRLYAGMEYDYDFIIRIKRSDIPEKIKLDKNQPPVIGWNTWLSNKAGQAYNQDETLDIKVSASRIN